MSDVTLVLQAIGRGEAHASDELLPLVYEELRRLASAQMAGEAAGDQLNIVPTGAFTVSQQFQLFTGASATTPGNFASIVGSPGNGMAFAFPRNPPSSIG
ncbi:MAG TPA: ECF-type sigma factor [Verrucomicrobiae bacterium]|nr:ECF-type sigma factor [Verrucomicrobiae bacterium]